MIEVFETVASMIARNVGYFQKSQEPLVVAYHSSKDTQLTRGFKPISANVGYDRLLDCIHSIACFLDDRVLDDVQDN